MDVHIAGEGKSLAEIMGSADGRIRIDIAGLEISNQTAGIVDADLFMKAFDILNPLSKSDDRTVIECAVVNFPVKGGIMSSKTGIGINTRKLNILGGGTVDFKTEKIDIGVNPKPREGIGLNLSSLSEFVGLDGTLANPRPTTDAKGAAAVGSKLGRHSRPADCPCWPRASSIASAQIPTPAQSHAATLASTRRSSTGRASDHRSRQGCGL